MRGSTLADRYIVVLDAGTTGARCLVFDQSARTVASRSAEWGYLAAAEDSPLAREFDSQAIWSAFCRLIADSLEEAGALPGKVAAIGATGQRQAVVFLDEAGREVYAGPNLDLRAVFEGGAIDQDVGDRVYRTTGHLPSFLFAPAKLRWFQVHHPDAYGRIASVLTLADWLVWRLSGILASEPTLAGEAGLLNIHSRRWCADLLGDMGLPDNSHIPLLNAGTVAGGVQEQASRDTGVPAGTPVVVCGADTQCGLLGMGVSNEGQTGIVAGWSAPLQMVVNRPILAPRMETWAGCYLTPDGWVVESSAGDAGNSYRWLAETLWGNAENAFSEMNALASAVPAGSEGTLVLLGPSRMDMNNLGLRQGGIIFPVPMTFNETSRGHLARAALEAMAYALKANLEQAESVAGAEAAHIALGGGMTQSPTWVRILADVLGREIDVSPTPNVSALGGYLCAGTATGDFASLEEAAESVSGSLETVHPDPGTHAEYVGHYERWLQTGNRLREQSL
jgi:autoinducer 2 (AI-2) kinase